MRRTFILYHIIIIIKTPWQIIEQQGNTSISLIKTVYKDKNLNSILLYLQYLHSHSHRHCLNDSCKNELRPVLYVEFRSL